MPWGKTAIGNVIPNSLTAITILDVIADYGLATIRWPTINNNIFDIIRFNRFYRINGFPKTKMIIIVNCDNWQETHGGPSNVILPRCNFLRISIYSQENVLWSPLKSSNRIISAGQHAYIPVMASPRKRISNLWLDEMSRFDFHSWSDKT
jgi:hypothetical protein